jgi:predicted phosphodiesterase
VDGPTGGVRHYRLSPEKLRACIDEFNTLNLSHIFHLGDFIDKGGMESMNRVLPIMQSAKAPHTLVLGNHDFEFPDALKPQVPEIMGLPDRYFSLKMDDWKFIVVDGNDVSLYAWPEGSEEWAAAKAIYDSKYPGRPTYNGALGTAQMNWIEKELQKAEKAGEKVILLCHFPVLPVDSHVLWNSEEVVEMISRYACVKAWMNGHNHAGDYAEYKGIHFVTFKGMVDTEETAYATVQFQGNEIIIKGRGREPDRRLTVKEGSNDQ